MPGEAGERLLSQRLDLLSLLPALDDAGRLADHRGLLLPLGAGIGVTRRDVADLVRHDRGDLGVVVGERQEPAGHEQVARGQRKGVDDRRIEDRHLVDGLARRLARLRELFQNRIEIRFRRRRAVFAAERGGEALRLERGRRIDRQRFRRLDRNGARQRRHADALEAGAGAKRKDERQRGKRPRDSSKLPPSQPNVPHQNPWATNQSSNSSPSGSVSSIWGPNVASSRPRTRRRRPTRSCTFMPAFSRPFAPRFGNVMAKSLPRRGPKFR